MSMMDRAAYLVLCLFLFLLFGRPADFALSSLHLPLVTSTLSLLLAVIGGGILLVVRSRIGLLISGLTIWFLITIPFSTYRGGSFAMITSNWFRSFLCFVLIIAICKQPHQVKQIIRVLSWSLLLTSLLALQFGIVTSGRLHLPSGLLTGPNELAGAIIIGILYWLFNFFDTTTSTVFRAFSALAILPMLMVVLKTGSRGSMLSLAIVLGLLFIGLPANKKIMIAFCGALVVLLAFAFVPDDLRRRYTTYFSETATDDSSNVDSPIGSTEHRLYLLGRSLEFTLTHPVFGVGPDQFATFEDAKAREDGARKGSWLGCHNTYTQISSETGIPGLALFVAVLVTAWRSTGRVYREALRLGTAYGTSIATTAQALRYVLVAYCVFFLFEHTAYMPFWPTLIGLIAALDLSFRTYLSALPKATPPTDGSPLRRQPFNPRRPAPAFPLNRPFPRPSHG
jgi:O-antigen ligase